MSTKRFTCSIEAFKLRSRPWTGWNVWSFFEGDALSSLKSRLEYLRADTNQTLGEGVADYEQDEAYRFDRAVRALDDEMKDPDDVFFEARDRKQAIREQMKELQSGLDRSCPKRKARRGKKKKRG